MNLITLLLIIFIIFAAIGMFVIPRFLFRRAIKPVIKRFLDKKAVSTENACTLDELGLKPRGYMENMILLRDYKQFVLDVMLKHNIVVVTEEGKVYLSQERLAGSRFAGKS